MELDLSFLKYCFENSLTPKFLRFKVSNRSLKSSDAYRQCRIRLLKEEISNKKSIIRQRQSELVLLKNHLKASMNVIDYAHICSIFLISNDKILTKQRDIQDCKIIGLIKGKGKSIDPENVILTFHLMCFQLMTSHYSLKVLIFHFLTTRLKFRNTLVLLSYFTVKSVILTEIAVIKNFSKVS